MISYSVKKMSKYVYRPTRSEALKAKCCECSANYDDGKRDCVHQQCPIYLRMPYAKHPPKFDWILKNAAMKRYVEKFKQSGMDFDDYVNSKIYNYETSKLLIPMPRLVRAKCFDCCNNFNQSGSEKGRIDCEIRSCSLYYWQPYRKMKPLYNWFFVLSYTRRHVDYLIMHNISKKDYLKKILKRKIKETNYGFKPKNQNTDNQ